MKHARFEKIVKFFIFHNNVIILIIYIASAFRTFLSFIPKSAVWLMRHTSRAILLHIQYNTKVKHLKCDTLFRYDAYVKLRLYFSIF
jgi:hypothetical protein